MRPNVEVKRRTKSELTPAEKKEICDELLAIYKKNGKILNRDLLRVSAITGTSYPTIVEIEDELSLESKWKSVA
ncbi:MAG: hypothetical protein HZA13_07230 [Nitrospirae bacterium]|nr:hypothetical protein [Nitrospirota bacterium]